ncbi:hypothetical protein [Robertmurraya andreesenii]|uniref:Flagellar protein FliT n=1 Tax=Anoxybacillus andreesenii TaxID=1325932 RepID=A0ABT9V818_9BACL|nr:hypothetical protein [Robertmurraya andreesenii]MDQ0157104.1 flagellar protein FliT [Robertmurraya andreesenii]
MEALVRFIKKTKQLLAHLEAEFPTDDREEFIETIQGMLNERELILKELPDLGELSQNNKEELRKLEYKLKTLLENHQSKIKQDIKLLSLQKKKSDQYADPYGNFSIDGMYLDKKK